MSLAVITEAAVVTCSSGVSVRVAVTKTGGRVGSDAGCAASEKTGRKAKKMRKKKYTKPPFPAKGDG
jgi:hypothetical protein